MSFTFTMHYHPDYQRGYGHCAVCQQGIEMGSQIMIGTGFFNRHIIRNHSHYKCWLEVVQDRAKEWFFTNKYKPKRMDKEKKAQLNRLRAKRYYIKRKGGEENAVKKEVEDIERRIAFVKAG